MNNINKAIQDIKDGKLIIIVDDRDREHEGDLFIPGITSSVETLNFMTKYARGLMCTPMPKKIAQKLQLPDMVENPTDKLYTPFTVSVDVKTAKTGISIFERHDTIKALSNKDAKFEDFTTPGRMFPLVGQDGGVRKRNGHTEAAIDMCRLAELYPVGVICEIIKDDGHMARTEDLIELAKKWDMELITISDIQNHINENEINFEK